jgi:hypothetical protein
MKVTLSYAEWEESLIKIGSEKGKLNPYKNISFR